MVVEVSSAPIGQRRTGGGVESEWDEWTDDPSREDWECFWITEGKTVAGNRREGRKASRTALHENPFGPRAPSVSLLRPPRSPGPKGIPRKLRCQPELPAECERW